MKITIDRWLKSLKCQKIGQMMKTMINGHRIHFSNQRTIEYCNKLPVTNKIMMKHRLTDFLTFQIFKESINQGPNPWGLHLVNLYLG